jgi:hypothetical protein
MRSRICRRTVSGRLEFAYHGFQESDFFSRHFLKRSKIDISGNLRFSSEYCERRTKLE